MSPKEELIDYIKGLTAEQATEAMAITIEWLSQRSECEAKEGDACA